MIYLKIKREPQGCGSLWLLFWETFSKGKKMAHKQTYKEKQEVMRNTRIAAGLISERYAGVSSIVFRMVYYHTALNRVLMTRTLNFLPDNYAYFHIDCMREDCVDGGFDLTPVVAELVTNHKNSVKGKIFCHGRKESAEHSDIAGHASLSYEIFITYQKQA